MKLRGLLISVSTGTVLILLMLFIYWQTQPVHLELGLFSSSPWNVPGPYTYTMYDEAITAFELKNPGIKISYTSGVLKSDYSEWLSARILKGREPDLFLILQEDFISLASSGILMPLNHFESSVTSSPVSLYDKTFEAGRLRQSVYACALELDPTLMFINTDLLFSLQQMVPSDNWTWFEFYNLVESACRDENGDGDLEYFGQNGYSWLDAIYANGGDLFTIDGRVQFSSENNLQAMEFFSRLSLLQSGNYIHSFESGKVLFAPFPFSHYRAYRYYPYNVKRYGGFTWDALPMPRGPNGWNASEVSALLAGISSRSRHKREALLFLEFLLTDDEFQQSILRYSHGVPVRKDILFSDDTLEILTGGLPESADPFDPDIITETIDNGTVTYKSRLYTDVYGMISREVAGLPYNQSRLRNALSKITRKVNAIMEQF